jgi:hypothetical protein
MPDQNTRADSLGVYGTGAGADGGTQADPNLSLGGYRSSREVAVLGATLTSPIANVTLNYVSGANGTGSGTLGATGTDTLAWTPPGGTQGPAVTVLNGETKILEGGGAGGANKYVRVTRTSAAALSGTATVDLSEVYNNDFGLDNVSSAEASAGDSEYRCVCLKNRSSVTIAGVKAYLGLLGTTRVSDGGQLGVSGAGTITTTGSFADWPSSGFCQVKTNLGAIREVVYYTSRTNTQLTVPAAGRGRLATAAAAGASTDSLEAIPGMRLGKEAPTGSSTTGNAQTVANENTAPAGITWNTGTSGAAGVNIGDMAAGAIYYLWMHREVPAGAVAAPSVLRLVGLDYDAA